MKINQDFIVTDTDVRYRELDVVASVKITNGEFKDVEFHFGSINVSEEENEDGTLTVSFDYDIISEDHKHYYKNEEFEVTLGHILNNILEHSLNEAEKRYKDELRAENTKTSDIG
jgi:hypothetical protein